MTFDSKWEAKRWGMLLRKLQRGEIHGLQRQVSFRLHCPGGHVVARYRADFVYIEAGQRVIEDAKGMRTAMFILKKKWLELEYGITIRETFAKDASTW